MSREAGVRGLLYSEGVGEGWGSPCMVVEEVTLVGDGKWLRLEPGGMYPSEQGPCSDYMPTPVDRQIDMTEIITFPQLRWWAVKSIGNLITV